MPGDPSPTDAAAIADALERVRDDVRSRSPSQGLGTEARDQAERYWALTAERPFLSAPGATGRVRSMASTPLKLAVRRLVRWYVEPALAEQRHFNAAILQLIDDLAERTAALERRREDA